MKTENNYSNKAAFFGMYADNKRIVGNINNEEDDLLDLDIDWFYQLSSRDRWLGSFLWLKPIDEYTLDTGFMYSETGKTSINAVDWLRANGYAIQFRDLSVEDLLSYGWIKIKKS